MKECRTCELVKTLDDFPKRSDSADGHRNECKNCRAIYQRNYYKNPPVKETFPEGYKRCSKCEKLLKLECFHKSKGSSDGLKGRCKDCRNADNKEFARLNPEYYIQWHAANKERRKKRDIEYRAKNKEKIRARVKIYTEKNEERLKLYKKAWYETNKPRIIANKKERRKNNIQVRLADNLRGRLYNAIKKNTNGNKKGGSAVKDLRCSIEFLIAYLEAKFQSGMSWANYGKWHVDHIMPISSFDLTIREQVKQACHYTNLQPLWAVDNLRKGNRIPNKGDK